MHRWQAAEDEPSRLPGSLPGRKAHGEGWMTAASAPKCCRCIHPTPTQGKEKPMYVGKKPDHSEVFTPGVRLQYGREYGVPEVSTAWGARAILTYDYGLDIVPNRVDAAGPRKKELLDYLNDEAHPLDELVGLRSWDPASEDLQTIFEDDKVMVVGSTNASHGYLYLRAWFKADELPDEPLV